MEWQHFGHHFNEYEKKQNLKIKNHGRTKPKNTRKWAKKIRSRKMAPSRSDSDGRPCISVDHLFYAYY